MSPKIACLLTSPTFVGGTETALYNAYQGFKSLETDVQSLAVRLSSRSRWSTQALEYVEPVEPKTLVDTLAKFDGVVLSNTYFADKYVPAALLDPALEHVKLTSGWHGNDVMKAMREAHETVKASPMWTGKYVEFWPRPLDDADVVWESAKLPYVSRLPEGSKLVDQSSRQYHLGYVGRVDPRKGSYGFALSAAKYAEEQDGIRVLIAGAPNDLPGGPLIHHIRLMLEQRGWKLVRGGEKMKSSWSLQYGDSVIDYTGAYDYADVMKILSSVKVFVNMTSLRASRSHFEYSTLEAFDAGCVVVAPGDVSIGSYSKRLHYHSAPMESVDVHKNGKRLFSDMSNTAETTYSHMLPVYDRALSIAAKDDRDYFTDNRQAVLHAHEPKQAAEAYMRALELT